MAVFSKPGLPRAKATFVSRALLLAALAGALLAAPALAQKFDWDALPPGRWVRVPTRGTPAPKVFHGGAAIAPERNEVYFFGSDTHAPTPLENGESNALWRLNLETLAWSQHYQADPKSASTYLLLEGGVTETASGRPWAMHTFDAVEWDPVAERLVVVSFPAHTRFQPGERFPFFRGDWYKRLRPLHWEYDPDTKRWRRLNANAPNLFAKALCWDSDRRQLIGHDGERTWHFDREAGRWHGYDAPTDPGWHLVMVYATHIRRALLLGKNGGSDVLWAYDPEAHAWSRVKVQGSCLPANGAAIAYDTRNGVMLYLANDHEDQYHNPAGRAVTFLYHAKARKWERLEIESPELYGMNYLMQYDPVRNVFLHFEKSRTSGDRIAVWAFRYR